MKILVVSDIESKFIWDHFDPERFRDIELIISCGDLDAKYLSFLVTMINCPLIYVPGNHDKRYAQNPPEGCICLDDRVLSWRGLRIMGLGGCKSPRKVLYEYSDEMMWKRVRKLEPEIRRFRGLDILVSHAPALGLGDGPDKFHEGFEAFRYVLDTYQPKIHFYGHRHMTSENPMDRRAIYPYGPTTMINAYGYKIVDYDDELRNMPTPPLPPRTIHFGSREFSLGRKGGRK